MSRVRNAVFAVILSLALIVCMTPVWTMSAYADDSRIKITALEFTLNDYKPTYGDKVDKYAFDNDDNTLFATVGSPAYFNSMMGSWWKKNGVEWDRVENETFFQEGIYRYEVQIRTDSYNWATDSNGYNGSTHMLAQTCTVKVDGVDWETMTDPLKNTFGYSFNWTSSPEYVVTKNASQSDDRIFGASRYDTAIKVADELMNKKGLSKFDNIVVATGDNYPDALTGGYLAYVKSAPILLVNKGTEGSITSYVKQNLKSGGKVYLLGGTGAVSEDFENGLNASGLETERLGGATRYETNLKILEAANVTGDELLICSGDGFADSLSASAACRPILLVGKAGLTGEQSDYLMRLTAVYGAASDVTIVGGTGAVSEAAEQQLFGIFGVAVQDNRLAGANRYETSYLVAKKYYGESTMKNVVFAYGQNFPDGLAGGVLAMQIGAPLILADSNAEALCVQYAKQYTVAAGARNSITLGGTTLISDTTRNLMMNR